ncbi:hypothetical protein SDC9_84981 [bioreactor metagenome]|uniref:Uncharacterized protein n=1 Tax=bioreactor metagenome TaxID=1076179 RepID=A0A644ZBT4_9ZZZZ
MFLLQVTDNPAQPRIQRRFAGTGKGDPIDFRLFGQHRIQFGDHRVHRNILFSLQRQIGRRLGFTIDAIQRTGLRRHQIHAKRDSQPSRSDRPEHIFSDHFDSLH